MQMTSACQNAVRAAQSALLAHADHVAISCPEKPCSVFICLLWGVQGPRELCSVGELVCLVCWTFVWIYVQPALITCLQIKLSISLCLFGSV